MRMLRWRFSVLAAGLCLAAASALAATPLWRDATRDVYVDGRLDRSAQVLVEEGSKRIAIVSPALTHALVLTAEKTFEAVPREAFHISPDRATAELSQAKPSEPGGLFENVERGHPIVYWKGKTVLVAKHQGLIGEVTEESLWQTVPVWKTSWTVTSPRATPSPG